MVSIETENWGKRVRGRPFPDDRPEIEILADVETPPRGRRPLVKIYFDAVPRTEPLGRQDMAAWNNCLMLLMKEADKLVSAMTK